MQRLAMGFLCLLTVVAAAEPVSDHYRVERIVAASVFHGVHGLAFDRNDVLHAGSLSGQSIYTVDTRSGKVETLVGPPEGAADDLVFLNDGTMVWTSLSQGIVRARRGDEKPRVVADKLASINSINVDRRNGRLFAAQVFGGNDAVWELDPTGVKPPRKILADVGGFNGFDVGADGWLYGPSWFRHQVVRINPDSGELKVISDDFGTPAAANFDSKGNLFVLDTARGELVQVEVSTGNKRLVATLESSLDNLAIDSRDMIYVSNMADNGIQQVDPRNGRVRQIVKGELSMPVSLASAVDGERDTLYVADIYGFRRVDGKTGAVTDLIRAHGAGQPPGYTGGVAANAKHVFAMVGQAGVHQFTRNPDQFAKTLAFGAVQGLLELPDGRFLVSERNGSLSLINAANPQQRNVVVSGLNRPTIILSAGPDSVLVLESGAGRIIQVAIETGTIKPLVTDLDRPYGLARTATGALLTIELNRQRLLSLDPQTGQRDVLATQLPVGMATSSAGTGVAAGSDGKIYFTSDIENSVWRLTPRKR